MSNMLEQSRLLREVRMALQQDDVPQAIKSLKRAANLAGESGDLGLQGRHLGNLALLYHRIKKPKSAINTFNHALELARQDGDRMTENGLLGNMGNILRELERYREARDYLNQALIIAQETGDQRGRGIWLGNLGLVYDDLNKPEKAAEYHQEAVSIARELNDMRGLMSRLVNLGNSKVAMEHYDEALNHFAESIEIYIQLGDHHSAAAQLRIMGNICVELGRKVLGEPEAAERFQAAYTHYQHALDITSQTEDHISTAEILWSMGNVLAHLAYYDMAAQHFMQAHDLFELAGATRQANQALKSIQAIELYRKQMDNQEQ